MIQVGCFDSIGAITALSYCLVGFLNFCFLSVAVDSLLLVHCYCCIIQLIRSVKYSQQLTLQETVLVFDFLQIVFYSLAKDDLFECMDPSLTFKSFVNI